MYDFGDVGPLVRSLHTSRRPDDSDGVGPVVCLCGTANGACAMFVAQTLYLTNLHTVSYESPCVTVDVGQKPLSIYGRFFDCPDTRPRLTTAQRDATRHCH